MYAYRKYNSFFFSLTCSFENGEREKKKRASSNHYHTTLLLCLYTNQTESNHKLILPGQALLRSNPGKKKKEEEKKKHRGLREKVTRKSARKMLLFDSAAGRSVESGEGNIAFLFFLSEDYK